MKVSPEAAERALDEWEAQLIDEVEQALESIALRHHVNTAFVREIYLNSRDAEDFGCNGPTH